MDNIKIDDKRVAIHPAPIDKFTPRQFIYKNLFAIKEQ